MEFVRPGGTLDFQRPVRTNSLLTPTPGTWCRANFQRRFATAKTRRKNTPNNSHRGVLFHNFEKVGMRRIVNRLEKGQGRTGPAVEWEKIKAHAPRSAGVFWAGTIADQRCRLERGGFAVRQGSAGLARITGTKLSFRSGQVALCGGAWRPAK